MTAPLADVLRRRIRHAGPISVAEFMTESLAHPEHGYYMTRDPLGVAGDFVTAPEISQMFGELIGLWCAEIWRTALGRDRVRLIELGPGRGTLMADALRAARLAPGFLDAATVHLVEVSPALAAAQRQTLPDHELHWHANFADVPAGPVILIANEFFDALPVHQLQWTGEAWCERMVGLAEDGLSFRLCLAPGASSLEPLLPPPLRAHARAGDVAEISPARIGCIADIARRIVSEGGVALIIDYGHLRSAAGETLQAVRGHRRHEPLQDPGTADLTAHVDFAALAAAAGRAGASVHGPIEQGAFLQRLGVGVRAEGLCRAAPSRAREIRAACHRLIAPDEMGTLFKVMALAVPDAPVPPGFGTVREDTTIA